ncbi:uncharacterized protein LOC142573835 [Dermacentor variabilis]|uniref:uncharacterized protein LOC142573835 n=1 Tax=Dermacentor variabilis TaxID=34621 RepID=UPI003F5C2C3E
MAKSSKAARLEYNDKLISAVQIRGIIWDCGRQDYKDQRKKAAAWAEIIADIGTDPEGSNVQARWKSLRDTFRKKYRVWKDGAPSGSGASESKHVRWPYFHQLMFLKDQMDIGRTMSNMWEPVEDTAESLLQGMYSEEDLEVPEGELSGEALPHGVPASCQQMSSQEISNVEPSTSHASSHESCPAPTLQCGVPTPKRKRTTKGSNHWELEMGKIDQLINDDRDQASLYGQILAHKLRLCPKTSKKTMEFELLEFFKKYTFDEI